MHKNNNELNGETKNGRHVLSAVFSAEIFAGLFGDCFFFVLAEWCVAYEYLCVCERNFTSFLAHVRTILCLFVFSLHVCLSFPHTHTYMSHQPLRMHYFSAEPKQIARLQ